MPEQTRVDWPKLIEDAITREGKIGLFYSRFHDYSFLNRLLFAMQGVHEPVASGSRWRELGRTIRDGARRKEVIVPKIIKVPLPEEVEPGEKPPVVERIVGFKAVRAVYALSDTEGPALPEVPTPGWDLATALAKLGVREVPFASTNGNIQGYSRGVEFAINPIAHNRNKTVFHELAHIVAGDTLPHMIDEYQTHRGNMEFRAEVSAMLCMRELDMLDDGTAAETRGYCQHWLRGERPPDKVIQQVFTITDRILRAGRVAVGDTIPDA